MREWQEVGDRSSMNYALMITNCILLDMDILLDFKLPPRVTYTLPPLSVKDHAILFPEIPHPSIE